MIVAPRAEALDFGEIRERNPARQTDVRFACFVTITRGVPFFSRYSCGMPAARFLIRGLPFFLLLLRQLSFAHYIKMKIQRAENLAEVYALLERYFERPRDRFNGVTPSGESASMRITIFLGFVTGSLPSRALYVHENIGVVREWRGFGHVAGGRDGSPLAREYRWFCTRLRRRTLPAVKTSGCRFGKYPAPGHPCLSSRSAATALSMPDTIGANLPILLVSKDHQTSARTLAADGVDALLSDFESSAPGPLRRRIPILLLNHPRYRTDAPPDAGRVAANWVSSS
jgi:hypothetical protein